MKPAYTESMSYLVVTLASCRREKVGPRSVFPGLTMDLKDCFPSSLFLCAFSRYGQSHLCLCQSHQTQLFQANFGNVRYPAVRAWAPGPFLTGL